MQRLEVSGAVRPLSWSIGVKGLTKTENHTRRLNIETVLQIVRSVAEVCRTLELRNPLSPFVLWTNSQCRPAIFFFKQF